MPVSQSFSEASGERKRGRGRGRREVGRERGQRRETFALEYKQISLGREEGLWVCYAWNASSAEICPYLLPQSNSLPPTSKACLTIPSSCNPGYGTICSGNLDHEEMKKYSRTTVSQSLSLSHWQLKMSLTADSLTPLNVWMCACICACT